MADRPFVSFCSRALTAGLLTLACNTPGGVIAGVAGTATIIGSQTPTQSIEQTYYVGLFDPDEQLPPAVYRITVRGQASAISSMRFASGWVPAAVVDGLGSRLDFDDQGRVRADGDEPDGKDAKPASVPVPGRGLMMFGPEGFREAPRNHRLAIVMGSSPQAFFDAVDLSLRTVVQVQQEQLESAESQKILGELYRLQQESEALDGLQRRVDAARASGMGGA